MSKSKNILKEWAHLDSPSKNIQGKEDLIRFIRLSMKDGKLQKAYKNIEKTFSLMKLDSRWPEGVSTLDFFEEVVNLASPMVIVRSVRVKGVGFQVPGTITSHKSRGIGLRWLLEGARRNSFNKTSFKEGLSRELFDTYYKTGYAYNKRLELHKLAEENRPFSHYRWWHKVKGKREMEKSQKKIS